MITKRKTPTKNKSINMKKGRLRDDVCLNYFTLQNEFIDSTKPYTVQNLLNLSPYHYGLSP